jgi:hypothetical protein
VRNTKGQATMLPSNIRRQGNGTGYGAELASFGMDRRPGPTGMAASAIVKMSPGMAAV